MFVRSVLNRGRCIGGVGKNSRSVSKSDFEGAVAGIEFLLITAQAKLGLQQLGPSPHSPHAGSAAEAGADGEELVAVCEAGRIPVKGWKLNPLDGKYYPPPQTSPLRAASKRASTPPPRAEALVQRVVAAAAPADRPATTRGITKRIQADMRRHKREAAASRRACWKALSCRNLRKWSLVVVLALLCVPFFAGSGDLLRGLGKGVNAAATLADGVAAAAGTVAEAGANISVEVAHATLAAMSTSKSVADNAWQGVDLVNITAASGVVRVAAVSTLGLGNWVEHGGGGAVPKVMAPGLARQIRVLHRGLPQLDFANASYDEHGAYLRRRGKVKHLRSNFVALVVSVASVDFHVRWANQFWELFEFDPYRQHPQVLRSLDAVIDSLEPPPEDLMTLDDSSVDTSSLPVLTPSPNLVLRYFVCMQAVLLAIGGCVAAGAFLQPSAETADGELVDDDIAVEDDFVDAGHSDSPDSGAGDMVVVEPAAAAASSSNG